MKKNYFFALTLFLSVFTISAVAQTVINTQNLSMDVIAKDNYNIDSVQFDLAQTLTDLGISSLDEAVPVVYASDGSFTTASNENSGGFFIGSADTIANWGVGGVVYITHFTTIDDYVGVGQFPDSLATYIDQSLTFSYGFLANDKVELLKITLNISEDPGIIGTIINTQTLSLDMYVNTDYSLDSVQFDVAQTLTDLGIGSIDEATVIAYDEDGKFSDGSNEGSGGFWLGSAGYKANWGAGAVVYVTHFLTVEGYVGVGQFPDSLGTYAFSAQPLTVKYGFLADEKIEMLEITVNAVPYTQEISIDVDAKANYDIDSAQFDLAQTLTDLGIESIDEAIAVAVMDDGSHDTISNENSGGFWIGSEGYKADWGAGGVVYVTHFLTVDGYYAIGQFPDSLSAYQGESLTVMYGLFANNKIEMLEITVNVAEGGNSVNLNELNTYKAYSYYSTLYIESSENSLIRSAKVYSIDGRLVASQEGLKNNRCEFSGLQTGLYITVVDVDGTQQARKVIVK